MSTPRYEPKFAMKPLFPPIDEHSLDDFVKRIGRPLPDDYAEFLRQWNGVFFPQEEPSIRFLDEFDEYDFAVFCRLYGLADETTLDDLRRSQNGYDFRHRVPGCFIAIGDDNTFNRVSLCLDEKRFGHVFFWQPGIPWEEEGENTPTEEYLRPVANSFAEFWESLYISEFPPD
jgi:hypothetical protein